MLKRCCFFIIALLTCNDGFAGSDPLTLKCQNHPQKKTEICVMSTHSEHFPVNDLVLYKRDKDRFPVFLEVIKGDVAVSWFWGFSQHGKYSVMGFAEEGHPYFLVYETSAFLQSEQRPKAIAVLSDYYLTDLLILEDDGTAHFAKADGVNDDEDLTDCFDADIDSYLHNDNCTVRMNIFDKSHTQ
ncbi:MAG: hypothetical protein ABJV04_11215 [Aliiglaciecola sp.]|uniref:hypothetical protein n=1 Tax=Aliiglaciecola sp. TaxID=1872441 RepID=UPI003297519B